MNKLIIGVLAFAAVAASSVVPAVAQGVGLDGLHDQRREGARWCMSDHFHTTSGSGPSKQAAERDAVAGWQGFTSWEYGDRWGTWQLAGSKSLKCEQNFGGWACTADARPCQPLARSAGRSGKRRAKN